MAVVADSVIVELEAKLDRYTANVNQAMRLWQQGSTEIRQNAIRAEQQVTRSFDGIRKALLASTSLLAGAAGLNAIKELADGYTRFTNGLKVAGVEGQNLGKVQNALYDTAQRYGVQLETLGTLYSRVAQSGKELGASQTDILRFTNGVAAAIKIQGGSAAEAQGALLQLSQALGGQIVRAEEFNSVNEGARPILQAVANGIEKYGGSVGKLRQDVIAGKVTSQDFFQGFLKGSAQLEAQAAKANLTIGASFTVLNNALGKYIGETDQALSITARIGQGIAALANNLDVIVPALGGIAAGFAALKLGPAVFDLAAAGAARALQVDQALAAQILAGNASYVSRTQLTLAQASATAAAAAAEVAALESEVAARTADVASTQAEVAAKQTLVASMGTNATTREALTVAVVANTEANAALIASETALAAAQGRAAVATEAQAVATVAAGTAARAGAAATALFSGAMATLTAALPFLAVSALVAGIIYYATQAKSATFDTKAFAEEGNTLAANLAQVDRYAKGAASAIGTVGGQAASSTSQVRAFAGAVGEAAGKLEQLARARRRELFVALATDQERAKQQAADARSRFTAASGTFNAKVGYIGRDENARTQAMKDYQTAQARIRASQEGIDRAVRTPLANYTTGSEREGGRDVEGELARVTRDLTVARKRGLRGQIDSLEAQKFELDQYKKYRASGLSPEAARSASQTDASDYRSAARGAAGDRSARTGAAAAKREAAAARAAARKEAAQVRDVAADAARFASQERRANNDIAAARAELANSAEERAAIEKARIEDERQNRNEELRQAFNQGQLGEGDQGRTRLLELQRLNDERATLEAQVVDLKERQRVAKEALDVQLAGITNERDLLQAQQPLLNTQEQRKAAALRLLDLQYEQERIELRAITVANGRTETEQKIAEARLAQLDKLQGADKQALDRQYEGPIAQFRRSLDDPKAQVEQAVADKLKSVDDAITEQAAKTLGVKDPFLKSLLQIFLEQNVLKPLYDAVAGASSGGGGSILGSVIGGLFGKKSTPAVVPARASGGHVTAGKLYRVNDGGGTEGFMPSQSGQIVPLGRMNKAGGGGTTVVQQSFTLDARYGITTPELLRHVNTVATRKAAQAGAASFDAAKKSLPGNLDRFQKLGTS